MLKASLKNPQKSLGGNPNGGLANGGVANGGLAQKAPVGPKKALSGEFLLLISPEKAPIGPEKAPIKPEKARFSRKDFCPIFSEHLGLKPPFVSPRLDFPKFLSFSNGSPRIF